MGLIYRVKRSKFNEGYLPHYATNEEGIQRLILSHYHDVYGEFCGVETDMDTLRAVARFDDDWEVDLWIEKISEISFDNPES